MTHDDGISEKLRDPGPEVTPRLFRKWQKARRGSVVAEDMTNPVWHWLFRGRVDPFQASERFKSRIGRILGSIDYPSEPRWAGCRLGQSRTKLADGRVFWIGGEHEDYYDPDFYIYNDVIVEGSVGGFQIFGYPAEDFRPTDFHSATAVDDAKTILLIGSIGYPDERDLGRTQIYALNTESLAIEEVSSTGDCPGWISKHNARLSDDGLAILVAGGEIMKEDLLLENIDEWSLSLSDFRWTRLTARSWTRVQVGRADKARLHLWEYEMRKFALEHPGAGFDHEDELAEVIGRSPDMEAYELLYKPPVPHSPIHPDPENEEDWQTKKIMVDGVRVRFADQMDHVMVTVEGSLSKSMIDAISEDLRGKLALVENADCQIRWID